MKARYVLPWAAVALLGSFALQSSAAQALDACTEVITCACNDATGECREFPTPCAVPPGWTIYGYGDCPVAEATFDCLDVISYARNPDTGECVEFPNSCIPPGWERCSGGA